MRSDFALLPSSASVQENLAEIIYRMKRKLNISLGQDMSQFRVSVMRVASIVRASLLFSNIKLHDFTILRNALPYADRLLPLLFRKKDFLNNLIPSPHLLSEELSFPSGYKFLYIKLPVTPENIEIAAIETSICVMKRRTFKK